MIKRAISSLLAAVLCFAFGMAAFAAVPTVSVSGASANENEVVTLKVTLEDNPGIASMKLIVDYDENVLELKDAGVEKTVTKVSGSMSSANEKDGKLILNWLSLTGNEFSEDGDFAEIQFKVKSNVVSGDSPVSVSYNADDVYNGDEVNVNFSIKNGAVKVNGSKKPSEEASSEAPSEQPEQNTQNEEQSKPSGKPYSEPAENERPSETGEPAEKPEAKVECGHVWGDSKITKEPTCTEQGEGVYICEICGEEKTEIILPLGHKFGEWKVLTEPTDEKPGEREHICNLCGYSEKEQFKSEEEQSSEPSEPAGQQQSQPTVRPAVNEKSGVSSIIIIVLIGAAVAAAGATFIAKKKK